MTGSRIEIDGVSKSYGEGPARREVLVDVNLEIRVGEFLAIVGFSGSGKTTLVSMIAGLTKPDTGTIRIDGRPVTGPGVDRGIVFQNYSLLPWMTVRKNVELSAKRKLGNAGREEVREYVERFVRTVGLGPAIDKYPRELSGGMRQRVAFARALALDPAVLLLDEPLSALDALTRARLQDELVKTWSESGKTVVMVTNDVDEALIVADRIVPLDPGPHATLGPAFPVDLDRPRDRSALNADERFVRLRNAVSGYLAEASRGAGSAAAAARIPELPDLAPAGDRRYAESRTGV